MVFCTDLLSRPHFVDMPMMRRSGAPYFHPSRRLRCRWQPRRVERVREAIYSFVYEKGYDASGRSLPPAALDPWQKFDETADGYFLRIQRVPNASPIRAIRRPTTKPAAPRPIVIASTRGARTSAEERSVAEPKIIPRQTQAPKASAIPVKNRPTCAWVAPAAMATTSVQTTAGMANSTTVAMMSA